MAKKDKPTGPKPVPEPEAKAETKPKSVDDILGRLKDANVPVAKSMIRSITDSISSANSNMGKFSGEEIYNFGIAINLAIRQHLETFRAKKVATAKANREKEAKNKLTAKKTALLEKKAQLEKELKALEG